MSAYEDFGLGNCFHLVTWGYTCTLVHVHDLPRFWADLTGNPRFDDVVTVGPAQRYDSRFVNDL